MEILAQSATALIVVVGFLLPGYIIASISEYFAGKKPEKQRFRETFRILSYGLVNLTAVLVAAHLLSGCVGFGQKVGWLSCGSENCLPASFVEGEFSFFSGERPLYDLWQEFDPKAQEASTEAGEGDHHRYIVGSLLKHPGNLLIAILYIFISPLGVGAAFSWWYGSAAGRRLGDKIGLPTAQPTQQTAMEIGLRRGDPTYVRLERDDGDILHAAFGQDSRLTKEGIYFEEVFDGDWRACAPPRGAWIRQDETKSLLSFREFPGEAVSDLGEFSDEEERG